MPVANFKGRILSEICPMARIMLTIFQLSVALEFIHPSMDCVQKNDNFYILKKKQMASGSETVQLNESEYPHAKTESRTLRTGLVRRVVVCSEGWLVMLRDAGGDRNTTVD
uniref:Secreted protein n=1 Tax=Panagrellus redivivus TaxID=6233 RepID=A0A7E4VJA6_PANRE